MYLTKSDFIRSLSCKSSMWFSKYQPKKLSPLSESDKGRIEQGNLFESLVRSRFPEGVLVEGFFEEAAEETQNAIDQNADCFQKHLSTRKETMKSHLGRHFRDVRRGKGIKLDQLAHLVGYKNINKGCRRINAFERSGKVTRDLLGRLAQLLGIDTVAIAELEDRDRQQRDRWKSEPIQPYLVMRFLAAVYSRKELPKQITSKEQAEVWAGEIARQMHLEVCLVWDRKNIIYFSTDGQSKTMSRFFCPALSINGQPFLFNFSRSRPRI